MEHTYLFVVAEDEDMLRGYFADFETLDTFGETLDEITQRGGAMLAVEILEMNARGEKLPVPSNREDYKKSLGSNEKLYSVTIDTDNYKQLVEKEEEVD